MKITVKLFASLGRERFDEKEIQIPNGITVLDLIKKLKINPEEVSIIFINNRHAELEDTLKDKDILALFPPIGGG